MNSVRCLLKACYTGAQTAASSLGLAAILGVVGAGSVYFAGQLDETDKMMMEAHRSDIKNDARRISRSSFALAKSLLSYRFVGAGSDRHIEAALYPTDYFNDDGWRIDLNDKFKDKAATWRWNAESQSLLIDSPTERNLTEKEVNQVFGGNATISDLKTQKARSVIKFSQVHFDSNNPYLAVAVEAVGMTQVEDAKGRAVRIEERARLPLEKPIPYEPYMVIEGPNGTRLDSRNPNGKGSSKDNPFDPGELTFKLFGSGLVSTGRIYWGSGNIASLSECKNTVGKCREIIFDEFLADEFWRGRTRNILAEDQLIGRAKETFDSDHAIVEKDSRGKNKADGARCKVDAEDDDDDGYYWGSYTTEAKGYTAFGEICAPDANECFGVRLAFGVSQPDNENVTWQDVKDICSDPYEKPECVTGNQSNDWLLPAYKKGPKSNGDFPMTFSAYHWDIWTQKMGVRDIKICIDGTPNLKPVAANCSDPIDSTSDQCWQENYAGDWTKNKIYYIHPVSCEPEFLFKRTACGCFSDDTKILMADRSYKRITDIKRGDRVWNPKTQRPTEIKKMVKGPEEYPMVHITTGQGLIKVTGNHPFPTPDGVQAAHRLQEGAVIYDASHKPLTIEKIAFVKDESPPVVWNLELVGDQPDDHYLVADGLVTGDLKIQRELENATRNLASVSGD